MFSHSFYTVRYQSAPELVRRLQNLKHKNSVLTKYANRMREKIEKAVEPELVTLDEEANNYLTGITDSPECSSHICTIPQSFFSAHILDAAGGSSKKEQGLQYALAPSHDSLVFVFEAQVSTYLMMHA